MRVQKVVTILVCLFSLLFGVSSEEEKRIIDSLDSYWHRAIGPVDFESDYIIFQTMLHYNPQVDSAFIPFTNEKLSKNIKYSHKLWMRRVFKPNTILPLTPYRYYLSDDQFHQSLICYQSDSIDGVTVTENINIIAITFPVDGINNQISVGDIFSIFDTNLKTEINSVDEFKSAFAVDSLLAVNTIYRNSTVHPQSTRSWQSNILFWIADSKLQILLFKKMEGACKKGLHHDSRWLNKHIYNRDSTRLVPPPSQRKWWCF